MHTLPVARSQSKATAQKRQRYAPRQPDANARMELIQQIVSTVAAELRSLSLNKPLGAKTGAIGCGGDETKTADQRAEEIIAEVITRCVAANPGERIVVIAEESGVRTFGDPTSTSGHILVIDPLDGSNNLRPWKTPSPAVAVSVAEASLANIGKKKNFELFDSAAVVDVFNNRTYLAKRSAGATVDSFGPIHSSPQLELDDAIIGVDLDCMGTTYEELQQRLKSVLPRTKCQRRLGSSILDFLKVASGEYDSFVSLTSRMKLYDLAAAGLIVREAGGIFEIVGETPDFCLVTRLAETGDNSLLNKHRFSVIASGNPELHLRIKQLLA